jgi:hypothetical protein
MKVASNGSTQAMDTRGYNGGHPYKAQVEVLDPDNHPCLVYTPAVDAPSGLSLDKDGFLIANAIPAALPIPIVAHCAAPLAYSATFAVNGPAAAPPAVATTDISDLATLALLTSKPASSSSYDSVCNYEFNDCDWEYTIVGGGEQSDLSSQNSQTNGFVDFIVRAPTNTRFGYAWTRVRLIGAPTNSNIQGIVTNVASASTSATTASIPSVGYALDYVAGFRKRLFPAEKARPPRRNPSLPQQSRQRQIHRRRHCLFRRHNPAQFANCYAGIRRPCIWNERMHPASGAVRRSESEGNTSRVERQLQFPIASLGNSYYNRYKRPCPVDR